MRDNDIYKHILKPNVKKDNSPDRTTNAVSIRDHAIVVRAFSTTLSPHKTTTARVIQVFWGRIFDAR